MNATRQTGAPTLLSMTTAAMLALFGLGAAGLAAADPVAYTAKAVLCGADFSQSEIVPELSKGKGKVYTADELYFWLVTSEDHPLMNGWQYNLQDNLVNKNGKGTLMGELTMYPETEWNTDGGYYEGWIEETYSLKTNASIEGTYSGVGSLTGVTITYTTELMDVGDPCPTTELPLLCTDGTYTDCQPLPPGFTMSVIMTGTVDGYAVP